MGAIMKWFNNEKQIREMSPREEVHLELQAIEKEIKWYDLKLHSENSAISAQQKLDLLKKKWVLTTGLKNNLF